ncbi:ATP-dependent DNA helicase RecG [Acidithrix sp. C25]|uniref:ATP-dependent DNA helicase RecG n=1 Tax=Acidithrix sp. C25 TaxID=1671482 RepID=UPI00191BBF5E|nr:ATP-dependent DNA helicase RecG [Acidithrix sp. C25]CAG4904328.1 unnamed protein product [Acidithrix sp. C25]
MNTCSNYLDLVNLPISSVDGITPAKAKALAEGGFLTAYDLATYFPRRYVDRRYRSGISTASLGQDVLLLVKISEVRAKFQGKGREIIEAIAADETGTIKVVFFNQSWRKHQLKANIEVALYGKVEKFGRFLQMVNPIVDLIGDRTGRIVPIYPHSEKFGFRSDEMPKFIGKVLNYTAGLIDPLPRNMLQGLGLISRSKALRAIHQPQDPIDHKDARNRLAFDEFLRLQTHLVAKKVSLELAAGGISHNSNGVQYLTSMRIAPKASFSARSQGSYQPTLGDYSSDNLLVRFLSSLPFAPTQAQIRVIFEISNDMASRVPMHRLLQGDVGAGKTFVAVVAALIAVQSGYQVTIMAPTEVLADQHYIGISRLLSGLDVPNSGDGGLFGDKERPLSVGLLTNKVTASNRRRLLDELSKGECDILIGTHALLSEGVRFLNLGLIVVDEQHRFGVEQRAILKERSISSGSFEPDTLIMTATPIPRTAAMTIFGDLDYSVLDELPPGRSPIITKWAKNEEQLHGTWVRVRREVAQGRQCYVVCPLVEDSEKIMAKSATAIYEELSVGELSGLRLGLLHGQMATNDKALVMERFRNHEIDVLVATTVIEVGVDVANATVMVIMDAGRFGIAQIHQLRGRVGRGAHQSYCYLVQLGEVEETTISRLSACVDSSDGFVLAEADLELRGEGTLLNARQKGRSDLRIASLFRDRDLLNQARSVSRTIVGNDPTLSNYPALSAEIELFVGNDQGDFITRN